LGRALLGKNIDAEIELDTPAGITYWTVIAIDYEERGEAG
jgi:transcription elongation GreA/GreB family factor